MKVYFFAFVTYWKHFKRSICVVWKFLCCSI